MYDDKNFDCKSGWSKRYNGFSPENWALLQTIYKNPSDIDLFTGGLSQEPRNNGLLGNVFNRMIGNYIKGFFSNMLPSIPIIINSSFLTFPACFKIPIIFSNLNYNCSNLLDMRNLQEQVKKHSVTKNCSDLSLFE